MNKKSIEEQFWSKVNKKKNNQCWEWNGARNKAGYGNVKYQGKHINAHRLSYLIHFGKIKEGYYVCHKCDNPPCVNPNHLFMGLPFENDKDKVSKGRQTRGSQHPLSKLTNEQVLSIRNELGSHQLIANKYKVSRRLIGMIKQGTIWKHLPIYMLGNTTPFINISK